MLTPEDIKRTVLRSDLENDARALALRELGVFADAKKLRDRIWQIARQHWKIPRPYGMEKLVDPIPEFSTFGTNMKKWKNET